MVIVQAPEADVLNLSSVPEEHEGQDEEDAEELEETIEAAKQHKRMLAERNASLQHKVHQVRQASPPVIACSFVCQPAEQTPPGCLAYRTCHSMSICALLSILQNRVCQVDRQELLSLHGSECMPACLPTCQ